MSGSDLNGVPTGQRIRQVEYIEVVRDPSKWSGGGVARRGHKMSFSSSSLAPARNS